MNPLQRKVGRHQGLMPGWQAENRSVIPDADPDALAASCQAADPFYERRFSE